MAASGSSRSSRADHRSWSKHVPLRLELASRARRRVRHVEPLDASRSRLGNRQHALQREFGVAHHVVGKRDLDRVLQVPHRVVQVVEVHAIHVRAQRPGQRVDLLVGMVERQPVNHVDLGPDGELRARGRLLDLLAHLAGRPGEVRRGDDLLRALRVRHHDYARPLRARLVDVLRREVRVDVAETLPQQDLRLAELLLGEPAELEPRIVDVHVLARQPLAVRDVPPEVLVRIEDDPLAALERPVEDARRVRRRADNTAVAPRERLELRVGVHVRHRDGGNRQVPRFEILPRRLDQTAIRHVRHGAAGALVRVVHLLVRAREHPRRLDHEAHAAEDDHLRFVLRARRTAELERVSAEVGEPDDLATAGSGGPKGPGAFRSAP